MQTFLLSLFGWLRQLFLFLKGPIPEIVVPFAKPVAVWHRALGVALTVRQRAYLIIMALGLLTPLMARAQTISVLPPTAICSGQSLTLVPGLKTITNANVLPSLVTASATVPSGLTAVGSAGNGVVITTSPTLASGTYTVAVRATALGTIDLTTNVPVVVNALPPINLPVIPTTNPVGTVVSLANVCGTGVTPVLSGLPTITGTGVTSTSLAQTVAVVCTNASGCVSQTTLVIPAGVVPTLPALTLNPATLTPCVGSPLSITVPGLGALNSTVTVAGGGATVSQSGDVITLNGLGAGAQTVNLTVTVAGSVPLTLPLSLTGVALPGVPSVPGTLTALTGGTVSLAGLCDATSSLVDNAGNLITSIGVTSADQVLSLRCRSLTGGCLGNPLSLTIPAAIVPTLPALTLNPATLTPCVGSPLSITVPGLGALNSTVTVAGGGATVSQSGDVITLNGLGAGAQTVNLTVTVAGSVPLTLPLSLTGVALPGVPSVPGTLTALTGGTVSLAGLCDATSSLVDNAGNLITSIGVTSADQVLSLRCRSLTGGCLGNPLSLTIPAAIVPTLPALTLNPATLTPCVGSPLSITVPGLGALNSTVTVAGGGATVSQSGDVITLNGLGAGAQTVNLTVTVAGSVPLTLPLSLTGVALPGVPSVPGTLTALTGGTVSLAGLCDATSSLVDNAGNLITSIGVTSADQVLSLRCRSLTGGCLSNPLSLTIPAAIIPVLTPVLSIASASACVGQDLNLNLSLANGATSLLGQLGAANVSVKGANGATVTVSAVDQNGLLTIQASNLTNVQLPLTVTVSGLSGFATVSTTITPTLIALPGVPSVPGTLTALTGGTVSLAGLCDATSELVDNAGNLITSIGVTSADQVLSLRCRSLTGGCLSNPLSLTIPAAIIPVLTPVLSIASASACVGQDLNLNLSLANGATSLLGQLSAANVSVKGANGATVTVSAVDQNGLLTIQASNLTNVQLPLTVTVSGLSGFATVSTTITPTLIALPAVPSVPGTLTALTGGTVSLAGLCDATSELVDNAGNLITSIGVTSADQVLSLRCRSLTGGCLGNPLSLTIPAAIVPTLPALTLNPATLTPCVGSPLSITVPGLDALNSTVTVAGGGATVSQSGDVITLNGLGAGAQTVNLTVTVAGSVPLTLPLSLTGVALPGVPSVPGTLTALTGGTVSLAGLCDATSSLVDNAGNLITSIGVTSADQVLSLRCRSLTGGCLSNPLSLTIPAAIIPVLTPVLSIASASACVGQDLNLNLSLANGATSLLGQLGAANVSVKGANGATVTVSAVDQNGLLTIQASNLTNVQLPLTVTVSGLSGFATVSTTITPTLIALPAVPSVPGTLTALTGGTVSLAGLCDATSELVNGAGTVVSSIGVTSADQVLSLRCRSVTGGCLGNPLSLTIPAAIIPVLTPVLSIASASACVGQDLNLNLSLANGATSLLGQLSAANVSVRDNAGTTINVGALNNNGLLTLSASSLTNVQLPLTVTVNGLSGFASVSATISPTLVALPGVAALPVALPTTTPVGSVVSLSNVCGTTASPILSGITGTNVISTSVAQAITVACQDLTTGCVSLTNVITVPPGIIPTLNVIPSIVCVGTPLSLTLLPGSLPGGITDLTNSLVSVAVSGPANTTVSAINSNGVLTVSGLTSGTTTLTVSLSVSGVQVASVQVPVVTNALPAVAALPVALPTTTLVGSVVSLSNVCGTTAVPILSGLPTIVGTGVTSTSLAQAITVVCQDLTTGCVSLTNVITVPPGIIPTLNVLPSIVCVGTPLSLTLLPGSLPGGITDLTNSLVSVAVSGPANTTVSAINSNGVLTVSGLTSGTTTLTVSVSVSGVQVAIVQVPVVTNALPAVAALPVALPTTTLVGSVVSLSNVCGTTATPILSGITGTNVISTSVAQAITVACQDLTTGCVSLTNVITVPPGIIPTLNVLPSIVCVGTPLSLTLLPGSLPGGITDLTNSLVSVAVSGPANTTVSAINSNGVLTVSGLTSGTTTLTVSLSVSGVQVASVQVPVVTNALPAVAALPVALPTTTLVGSVVSLSNVCGTTATPILSGITGTNVISTSVAQAITVACQDLTTGCVSLTNVITVPPGIIPTLNVLPSIVCVGTPLSLTLLPGSLPGGITDLTNSLVSVAVSGPANTTVSAINSNGVLTVSGLTSGTTTLTVSLSVSGVQVASVQVPVVTNALPAVAALPVALPTTTLVGSVVSLSNVCGTTATPILSGITGTNVISTSVAQAITVACQDLTTGCVSLTNVITVPPGIIPTLNVLPSIVCVGTPLSLTLLPGSLPGGITDLTNSLVSVAVSGPANTTVSAINSNGVLTVSGLTSGTTTLTVSLSVSGVQVASVQVPVVTNALPAVAALPVALPTTTLVGSVVSLSNVCGTTATPILSGITGTNVISTSVAQAITVACQDLTTGCVSLTNVITVPPGIIPTLNVLPSIVCVGTPLSLTLLPGSLPGGITDLTNSLVSVAVSGPANTTVSAINSNGVLTVSGLTSGTTTLTVSLSVSGVQVASVQVPVVTNALPAVAALPVALPTTTLVGSVVSLSNVCGTTATPILSGITGTSVLSTSLSQAITVACQDLTTGCVSLTSIITVPPGIIPTLNVLPSIVCVGTPLSLTLLPGSLPGGITDLTNSLVSVAVSGPANTTVSAINSNGVLTVSGLTSGTTTLTVSLSVSGVQVASVQVPVVTNALPAVAALPVALPTTTLVGSVVSLSNVCGTTATPILSGITGTNVISTSVAQAITVACQDLTTGCVSLTNVITVPPGIIPTLNVLPSIVCVGTPLSLTLLPGSLPGGITDLTNSLVSVAVSGPANTTVSAINSNGVLTVSGLTSGTTTLTVSLSVSGVQVASVQVPVVTNALPAVAALPVALPTTTLVGSVVSLSNVCGTTATPILSGITGTSVLSTSLSQAITVACQDLTTGCVSLTSIITVPPGIIPTLNVLPSIVCVGTPLSLTLLPGSLPGGITDLTNSLVSVAVSGPANTTVSAINSNGVLTVSGLTSGTTTLTVSLSVSGVQVASVQVPVVTNALPAVAALPVALPTTTLVGSVVSLSNVCGTTATPILSGITGTNVISTSVAQAITVACQDLTTGCVSLTNVITVPPGIIPTLNVLPSIVCVGTPLSLTLLPGSLPGGITDLTNSLVSVAVSGPANTTVSAINSNGVLTVSGLTSGTTTLTVSLSVSGVQVASVQVPVVTNALPAVAALPVALPTTTLVGSVVSLSNVCGTTATPILSGITGTNVISTSVAQAITVACQDLTTGCVSLTNVITVPPGIIPTLNVLPSIVCVGTPLSLTLLPGSLPGGITDLTNSLVSVAVSGPANTTVSAINSNGVLTVSGLTSGTTTLTVSLSVSGVQVASVQVPVVTNALPAVAALPVALPTTTLVGSVVSLSNVCGTTATPILSGITGTSVLSTSLSQAITVACQDLTTGCVSLTSIITVPPGIIPTLNVLPSIVCVGTPLSLTLLPGSLPGGITDLTNSLVSVAVSGPANTTVSAINSNGVLTVSGLTSGTTTLTVSLSVSGVQVASVQVPVVTNALPAVAALPVALPTTTLVGSVVSLSNVCGTTAVPILSGLPTIVGTGVTSTSLAQAITVVCQDLTTGCVSLTNVITVPPGIIPTLNVLPSIVCVGTPLSLTLLPGSLPGGITDLTNSLVSVAVSGPANTTVSAINSNGVLTVSGLTSGTTTLTVSLSVSGVQVASVQVPVVTNALPAVAALPVALPTTTLVGSVVSLSNVCGTTAVPILSGLPTIVGTGVTSTSLAQAITVVCQDLTTGCVSLTNVITVPPGIIPTLNVLPSIVCVGTPLSLTLLPGSLPGGITDLTNSLVSVAVSGPANTTVSAINSNGVLTVSGLTSGTTTLTVSLSVSGVQVASVQVPVVTNALPAVAALPVALPTTTLVGSVVSLSNVCGTTAVPILSGITGTSVLSTSVSQAITVACQDLTTGCVSLTSIITVPPGILPTLPTPILLPATLAVCLNSPVSITVTGLQSITAIVNFALTGGTGTLSQVGNVLTLTGLPTGVQTLTLTASALGYVSVSVPVSVTVYNPTAPTIAGGNSLTIGQGSVGALIPASCSTGSPVFTPSATIDATSAGVFNYTVACQDGPCTSASVIVTVTVTPLIIPSVPTPIFSPSAVVACLGSAVSVTVSGLSSVTSTVSFATSAGTATYANNVLSISGLPAGVQTLTLTASAAGYTSVSVLLSVTVLNPTAPAISGGNSQTVVQFSTLMVATLCATGTAVFNPSPIDTGTPGVFTYLVTCQDGPCTSPPTTLTVTVTPRPTPVLPPLVVNPSAIQVCLGSPVSVTVNAFPATYGTVVYTASSGTLTQSGIVLTISGLTAGVQTLTLTASAAGFGSVSAPLSVTVYNPTAPTIASGTSQTVTQGTTALLSASCATGTPVYAPSASINTTATGVFTYSVTCQDGPCVSPATLVTVTVAPVPTPPILPTPVLSPSAVVACLGSAVSVTVSGLTSVTSTVSFATSAGTATYANNVLSISGLPAGVQTLTLTASAVGYTSVSVPLSVTVLNPTAPAISGGNSQTVTQGTTALLSASCATGSVVYAPSASINTAATGVFTYSVTCQAGPCVSPATLVSVTVAPVPTPPTPPVLPTPVLSPSAVVACLGSAVNVTVSGLSSVTSAVTYTVSSGTLTQSGNALSISGLPAGVQTLTLTASAAGYTSVSVPLSVTVLNPTAPTIAAGTALTVAVGAPSSLIPVLCATGTPVYRDALGNIVTTLPTNVAGPINYTATCQDGPCVSTGLPVRVIVQVPLIPLPPITLNPATIQACLGSPVSVTVSGLGNLSSSVSYMVSGSATVAQSGSVLTFSNLPTGVQTLTLTASLPGYTSVSIPVSVTVYNPTAPTIAGGNSLTIGQGTIGALLTASCATGTPNYLPGNSIATSTTGVFTYTVTCQDGPCTSLPTTVTVTINSVTPPSVPTPILSPSAVVACLGSPVSVTVSGLSSVTSTVSFATSAGTVSYANNTLSISGLSAGVQTLTLTASAAGYTSVSVPLSVTVLNPTAPVVAGGTSQTVTQGTTALLSASCATGSVVYAPSASINTAATGVFTYSVTCQAGPCVSPATLVTVTVAPVPTPPTPPILPTPVLSPSAVVACLGSAVSVTVSGLSSVTSAVTYTVSSGTLTQSGNALSISGLPAGVQTLTLTASAAGYTSVSVPLSVTVLNPTAPVVAGGNSQTVIQGTTALLSASCATGSVVYAPSASINTAATGVFTYSVTCQAGPCVSPATLVSVTVAPVPTPPTPPILPTPVFSPSAVVACLGSAVSVTVSGLTSVTSTVSFATSAGTATYANNVLSISGLSAGVQTLTLTASAAGYTSVSVPLSVTVFNPTAPVVAGGNSQTVIQGTTALLSASCATGSVVYAPSASINTTATGVFTYSVTCQAGPCVSPATLVTVTVAPVPTPPTPPILPTPVLSPSAVVACLGSPVSVTVSGLTSVTSAVTYTVSSGTLTQSGNALSISGLPAGVQTLTLTASAAGYTSVSVPLSVTVLNPTAPVVAGGTSQTVIQGTTALLSASCATGSVVYAPSASINTAATGVFTYSVTCQAGPCVSPATLVTVTVAPVPTPPTPPILPTPVFSPSAVVACLGSAVSVTVSGLTSVTSAVTYTVSSGTLTQSGSVLTISGLPAGVQTLTLTASAAGYTSVSVLLSVTVLNPTAPVVAGGTSQTVTQGTTALLSASCATGSVVYAPSASINTAATGVFTYSVTCQAGPCVSPATLVTVTVAPVPTPPTPPILPTPVLSPSAVVACLGSAVSVTVSGLSSVTSAVTYTVSSGTLTQSGNALSISGLPAGVQTLTLTASAAGYTSVSVPLSVTVLNPTAPTIAGGNSLTIGQGSVGALITAFCTTGTPVFSPSATITATTPGVSTYTVVCQAGPCVSPATTVTVTVTSSMQPSVPTPILNPTALQACPGMSVSVTVSGLSSVTSTVTYTVSSGILTQSGDVLTIIGLPAGVQTLTLTASAAGYTSTSVSVNVTVGAPSIPVITGGNSQTVDQGTVAALVATCATGTPVYTPSNLINAETSGVLNYIVICQQGSCQSAPVLVKITVRPMVVVPQCGSNLDGTPLRATAPIYDCALITTTGEIRFTGAGGTPNGGPVEFMSIGVTGWTTNCVVYIDRETRTKCDAAPIEIRIRQLVNGTYVTGRTYVFDIRRLCPGPLNCPAPALNHDPVVLGGIPNQVGKVGTPFLFEIPQNAFTDPDGNNLVYVVNPTPPGGGLYTSSGLFFGTPQVAGVQTLTVTAYDNYGGSVTTTFTITILPADGTIPNPPRICNSGIIDGSPLRATVPVFSCSQLTTTGAIQFAGAGGNPNGGWIEFMAAGITGWTTNCQATIDPSLRTKCDVAPIEIKIRQLVNGMYVYGTSYFLNIRQLCPVNGCVTPPTNRSPVVSAGIPDQTGKVGVAFNYQIPANAFSDPDADPLIYTVSTLPAGLSFANGVFSGVPQTAATTSVTVTASDGKGGSVSTVFRIVVLPANAVTPPTPGTLCGSNLDGTPLRVTTPIFDCALITTTGEIRFTAAGGNPNGGPIEFMSVGITGWTTNCQAFVDRETRTRCDAPAVEIRARQLVNGVYVYGTSFIFDIRRLCPIAGCSTPPSPNRPPVVSAGIPDQTGKVGVAFNYQIPANAFSDPDGNYLVYEVSATPAGISTSSGLFIGTPQVAGTTSVTVTAFDGYGGSVATVFKITVSPASSPDPVTQTPTPPAATSGCGSVSLDGTPLRATVPVFDCTQLMNTGQIRFMGAGGNPNGGPVEFMAIGITNWTTNCQAIIDRETRTRCDAPAVEIRIRQLVNGSYVYGTSFIFDIRRLCPIAGCSTPPSQNRPPVVMNTIPDQYGKVGMAFNYQIPQNVFFDADGNYLVYAISATPAGISFSGDLLSGVPQTIGTTSVTVTAFDGYGGMVATSFLIIIDRLVSTSQPTPAMGATSRVAAPETEGAPLNIRVFGNPTANETIDFDVEGAAGKAVRLIVIDSNGRTASEHTIDNAASVEHQTMRLGQTAGLYLLKVSTDGQSKTVKIIKQ